MKKLFSIFALLLLSLTLVACNDSKEKDCPETTNDTTPVAAESDFKDVADGIYFAASEFDGAYRYFVTLEVKDGKLIDAKWDGYNQDMGASGILGKSKYDASFEGLYGMDNAGNNVNGKWYRQADRVVANLIETQQLDALTFNDSGKTDEVAGVTIHFSEFYDMVNDAIEAGPITQGDYRDGFYYIVSEPSEDKGDRTMLTAVVVKGKLVVADLNVWLGTPIKTGTDTTETTDDNTFLTKDSAKYAYGMEAKTGAESDGEWFVQAARLEQHMLTNQAFDINVTDTAGHQDTVANVSIKVNDYIAVWNEFDQQANSKYQYSGYADGYYFAAQDTYSDYRYYVILKIENNRLTEAELNGYAVDGSKNACAGESKYVCSENGTYGMDQAPNNVNGKWSVQADRIETYAIENQKLFVNYKDTSGHTDDIAGVTIHVSEFFDLAKVALEAGPISEGTYEDGYYYVDGSADATDPAKFDMGTFVVVNGSIVLADLNAAYPKTVGETDYVSKDAMKEGYGMNANNPWYIQAQRVEEYILSNQDLDVDTYKTTNDEGVESEHDYTDDIANVSVGVDGFITIFDKFVDANTPAVAE
jgi:major membrane immunogen (membrane-anchored lipoprotein)